MAANIFTWIFLFLCMLSLPTFSGKCCARSAEHPSENHIVDVSSLLPSASCTPSTTIRVGNGKSSLAVVHRHGPCSPSARDVGVTDNIDYAHHLLWKDQSRVHSIQAKVLQNKNKDGGPKDSRVTVPAKLGLPFDSLEYVVIVKLGTPPSSLSLIFDTGSDVTWTQCKPCREGCYALSEPLFDPSKSSSYANLSCAASLWRKLAHGSGISTFCSGTKCDYGITYGDLSFSYGDLATENLMLTPEEVISNFIFGCGQMNFGFFGEVAGLLGLARDSLSIIGQTASKYGQYFSYCLPYSSSSTGYLTFGKSSESSSSLSFTPMSTLPQRSLFYGIDILQVAVGGNPLPVPSSIFLNAGAIIDSGTIITRLPPTAYNALRTAFRHEMSRYRSAPAFEILDTCYDFSNVGSVVVPKIRFTFRGGAYMDLDQSGILYAISDSQVCLAFAPNRADTDLVIYGNVQQKTFEVIYDVAGGQLGFAQHGCS